MLTLGSHICENLRYDFRMKVILLCKANKSQMFLSVIFMEVLIDKMGRLSQLLNTFRAFPSPGHGHYGWYAQRRRTFWLERSPDFCRCAMLSKCANFGNPCRYVENKLRLRCEYYRYSEYSITVSPTN